MSIESAVNASREGLQVHGQAISVVGDNISNSNTTAFKGSRIEFANLLEVGSGVQVQGVRRDDQVGVIEQTGRSLDAAIAGEGYFVVGTTAQQLYSRSGNFSISTKGDLVEASGKTVLGYKANSTTLAPINLYEFGATGSPTTSAAVKGNINSQEKVQLPPTAPTTFQQIGDAANYVGSMTVFDSLGTPRDVTLAYTKTAEGTWTAQAYVDGADIANGTAGTPVQVGANLELRFNTSGVIEVANQGAAVITGNPAFSGGAAAGQLTINLGQMTQFAGGSQLAGVTQDGKSSGSVTDYRFDADGTLYAVLDSGAEAFVAKLPVATFRNEEGLERIGGNLFTATGEAGQRTLGVAGEGVAGKLEADSLERSTVDLAEQFVDLILYQRGYQASSQALSAASDLIKSTIGLIR
jgi:flagellar hook protein FlgE